MSPDAGSGVAHAATEMPNRTAETGSGVAHTATMMPVWSAETDIIFSVGRNRIGLMNQRPMVRLVLQDAIENVHVYLVLHHAFPDSSVVLEGARAALRKATKGRLPDSAGILNRLRFDEEYFLNMSVIVSIT